MTFGADASVPAPAAGRRYGLLVDGEEEAATAFVWEVGADLIDLDHWARSYVAASVAAKKGERSARELYAFIPMFVLAVVVIGATSSIEVAVGAALLPVSVFLGAHLLNRSAATRLAKQLRRVPAASEPFTFRADPSGTSARSASSSEEVAWSRWKSVGLHEDLVVLTFDTGVVRILPARGLTTGSADAAVAAIGGWIAAARPS